MKRANVFQRSFKQFPPTPLLLSPKPFYYIMAKRFGEATQNRSNPSKEATIKSNASVMLTYRLADKVLGYKVACTCVSCFCM